MKRLIGFVVVLGVAALAALAADGETPWERANPVKPLPAPPLGVQGDFAKLAFQVTPEKVRLGRWLFYDKRLSADGTISCATCHRPENAFSEPTPTSTGIRGQVGARKAPTFLNGAWPFYEVYFWDGRAASLIEQAKGPIANPIEMGNTHEACAGRIATISGYRRAFREVYGDERIDIDRIAEAIAAYEATRMSGDSRWDRTRLGGDESAMTAQERLGEELFFGKAECSQCHAGWNLTDSKFHNIGIGVKAGVEASTPPNPEAWLEDLGRVVISGKPEDTGAFKTPTLRDVTKHAPYMHDGSIATLREVVEHYARGGVANPWLSKKIRKLDLTSKEIDAVVAFLKALDGEGYQDTAPEAFPE